MSRKEKARRRYPLDQCALYKLESKHRLASLLGVPLADLQDLAGGDLGYRCFTKFDEPDITGRCKKPRDVQEPVGLRKRVHLRLFELLARIEVPGYLYSGTTGKSYVGNAARHVGCTRTVKHDISAFYPSTKKHRISRFFRETMQCSEDAATLLAALCTYRGALPTGSSISGQLAYFSHHALFERLSELASSRGLVLTVYVDDIVLSGPSANHALRRLVAEIVCEHQLSVKPDKARVYGPQASKVITGVVVAADGLKVPHARQHKVRLLEEALIRASGAEARLPILESLVGALGEMSQIEPRFRGKLEKHVRRLRIARHISALRARQIPIRMELAQPAAT